MSPQRTKALAKKSVKAANLSSVTSCKNLWPHLVKTHFQTACESNDLNIDFLHLTMASNSYAHRYLCKNDCSMFKLSDSIP